MTYALDAGMAVLFDVPAHHSPTTGLEPLDTEDQTLMVWFKVDDSFYDHPKTEELSDSAIALWTRAGSYCAKHLTDGFISHRKADRMCDSPAIAITELLDAGLWERAADGYRFHDWHEYQPTREEALATSKAKSVGGAVGNHRRWHVERGKVDPECPYCSNSHRSTDRITDQSSESLPNRPTRPDPAQPKDQEHPSDVLFDEPSKSTPPKAGSDDDPDWLRFWAAYPKKTSKKLARQRWASAMKQKHDPEEIIRGAQQYADRTKRERTVYQFLKNPDGWLNGELWRDEAPPEHGQDRHYALPSGHTGMNDIALRDVKPQAESAEVRKARGWLALPTGGVQ